MAAASGRARAPASGRALRFLESLPSPAAGWMPWFKFAIIQTSNHKTLLQQCLDNDATMAQLRRRRPNSRAQRQAERPAPVTLLSRLLGWERLARAHHRAIISLYLFFLLKYRLLGPLGRHLAPLDCFVLGRFRFVGRTNKISGEMASVFLFAFLVYRMVIHLFVPKFKFYALEFLMTSREELQAAERAHDTNEMRGPAERAACEPLEHLLLSRQRHSDAYHHHHCHHNHHDRHDRHRQQQQQQQHELARGRGQQLEWGSRARSSCWANSIVFMRSPFNAEGRARKDDKWIRRPNRTLKSWLTLTLATKLMVYWSAYVLVGWSALMYALLAGSVLTNLGFELAYPACVAWLRDGQTTHATSSEASPAAAAAASPPTAGWLYRAPARLAHELAIDDLPAWIPVDLGQLLAGANWYALVRICVDILENHLIYGECILLFIAQFYILIINSIDVVLNAREIKRRLGRLLSRLERRLAEDRERAAKLDYYSALVDAHARDAHDAPRAHSATDEQRRRLCKPPAGAARAQADLGSSWGQPRELAPERLAGGPEHWLRANQMAADQLDLSQVDGQLKDEMADLQAILADHFQTITHGYNLYVSFMLAIMGLCWLSYTLVVCAWMSSVRSRAIELEFLIAESGVTLFCLALASGAALVRSNNLQLYGLVTRAMALDPDWSATKPRWTSILRYFYPKPFHCFTLFGSTEISLLLGLKLISWILSAFIVLANFFYTSRP